MARTVATLPAGNRISDYFSLGVIAKFFPAGKIHEVLKRTNRASIRERDLPAHVVIYYVIALALYMRSSYREVLRCLLECVQWLLDRSAEVKVAGKSGISQARSRLGAEPVKKLYDAVVAPIAEKGTKGAWYRQWRMVSLDGSTLDVADTAENQKAFGRPGVSRGSSAFPKIRFVALLENGTHVLWAAHMDKYATDELTLAGKVIPALRKGMLCLADSADQTHSAGVRRPAAAQLRDAVSCPAQAGAGSIRREFVATAAGIGSKSRCDDHGVFQGAGQESGCDGRAEVVVGVAPGAVHHHQGAGDRRVRRVQGVSAINQGLAQPRRRA